MNVYSVSVPVVKLLLVAGILSDMTLVVGIWVALTVQWDKLVILSNTTAHLLGYLLSFLKEVV